MLNKQDTLEKIQRWFRESVMERHLTNTQKLTDPSKFNINPFTTIYLANFLTGNTSPESIARALLYPRVMGTSIGTTFGNSMQQFISQVLDSVGSTTAGIDIEFTDATDGFKKYCQLKAGPNTINKDDVETIAGHFTGVINLARTNNLRIAPQDMIVGVLYGEPDRLSGHYKRITKQYHFPVHVGQSFWHRLTGDEGFYFDMIRAIAEVSQEANFRDEFEAIVASLAASETIQHLS